MSFKVKLSRGIVQIKDLKAGSVFLYRDKIAVKTNKERFSFEHCDCVVLGTGSSLYQYEQEAEEFNETFVTVIEIYEEKAPTQ